MVCYNHCVNETVAKSTWKYYLDIIFSCYSNILALSRLTASVYLNQLYTKYIPRIYQVSHQFLWPRFISWPELGHKHDQQFRVLTLLKASQTVLSLGSQNLYAGSWYTISSQLQMSGTCHLMFVSYIHWILLVFTSVETGPSWCPGIQYFLLIWFGHWSEIDIKRNARIVQTGTFQYLKKKILSCYRAKLTTSILEWELSWEIFSKNYVCMYVIKMKDGPDVLLAICEFNRPVNVIWGIKRPQHDKNIVNKTEWYLLYISFLSKLKHEKKCK